MSSTDLNILNAIIFSAVALLLFGGLAYWFYLSPRQPVSLEAQDLTARQIDRIVSSLAISSMMMISGALWDASMHLQTGEIPGSSEFLWPPHLLIYASFLIALVTGLVALSLIARKCIPQGHFDPRIWIRSNPYLGAVALSSLFTILSIPGDAFWHGLFGIDLIAWSPPHILLGLMSSTILISAVGLLMQKRLAPRRRFQRDFALFLLLALMMNVLYTIGVLEWELPAPRSPYVEARPMWSYPMVAGSIAFFTIMLAKRLTVQKWAATWTVVLFYMVRLLISIGLDVSGGVVPNFPLPFFLGAILVDAVSWQRIPSNLLRALAASVLFNFGYALITLPMLQDRPDMFGFSPWDFVWTIITTLLIGFLLLPVTRAASRRLAGHHT